MKHLEPNLRTRRLTISEACDEILEAKENPNSLFFFVGSGVSIPSGLPSWKEFITASVERAFESNLKVDDLVRLHAVESHSVWLLEAAIQFAVNSGKISEYDLLKESLWGNKARESLIRPSIFHYLLARTAHLLNVPIFTTNFDTLLYEAAKETVGGRIKLYSSPKDIGKINERNLGFAIVHLHGIIPRSNDKKQKKASNEDEVVASQFDYYDQFNNKKNNIELLTEALKNRRCVFVGASLSDHNINRCLFANSNNKPTQRAHLWFTTNNAKNLFERKHHENLWQLLSVKPIYCNKNFHELSATLRRISNFLEKKSSKSFPALNTNARTAISTIIESIVANPIYQRCVNPWDQVEFDFYLDHSNSRALKLSRVWTSKRFSRGAPRSFTFEMSWKPKETFGGSSANSPVADALDCLRPAYLVPQVLAPTTKNPAKTSKTKPRADSRDLRCWGYISFPIVAPKWSRAAAMVVMKFANRDNWLATHIQEDGGHQISQNIMDLWSVTHSAFFGPQSVKKGV